MRRLKHESQWALLLGTNLAVRDPSDDGSALTTKALSKWLTAADRCLQAPPGSVDSVHPVPRRDADWLNKRLDGRALLAARLAELERQGIQVTTLFEEDYPRRLRHVLGEDAPPILFYAGNLELANAARTAGFVGSRNASPEALQATQRLASSCAAANVTVCSGGARGVDREAEDAILDAGGRIILCPPEGLSHVVRKRRFRAPMAEGRMLCVSALDPGAGWQVRHAMERNALIYAFSTIVCVMHAEGPKGGTWAGATESLARGETVVATWRGPGHGPGNVDLQPLGARPVEDDSIGQVIQSLRKTPAAAPSTQSPPSREQKQAKLFEAGW